MGRKPQYNIEQIFEDAIPSVSMTGYKAMSMERLINLTGFNRRAFYKEFSTKKHFFEQLAEYYVNHHLSELLILLSGNDTPLMNIQRYFDAYRRLIEKENCLLVTLLLEMGNESDSLKSLGREYYDRLTQHFFNLLEKAQASNDLPSSNLGIETQALQLMLLTQSMAVNIHLPQGKDDIDTMINGFFSLETK